MDLSNYLKTHLAKSNGTNIERHIQDLLEQLNIFIERYPKVLTKKEKELLEIAIQYHDYGKLNKLFQCKLPTNHQLKPVKCSKSERDDKVAHQFLSPLFLRRLEDKVDRFDLSTIIYSIINHHARGQDKYLKQGYCGVDRLLKEIKENIFKFFSHIGITQLSKKTEKFYERHLEFIIDEIANVKSLNEKFEKEPEFIQKLVKVAGLLIKIDHAASGDDLVVEEPPIQEDREFLFKKYLAENNDTRLERISLRPFQEKFRNAENLVLVADTGLGKTGLAVLWSKRKMFYVLPNRTSTNAMYDTLEKVFGKGNVGLLHSTSLFYVAENRDSEDYTILRDYDNTRNLSKPVTVATADQLFTAVFKYPTYEKIYATLSYSDVVIDEIQGFDPAQIVPIIKQIKETTKLGTRYLIITATLPEIVKKEFEKMGFVVKTDDPETIDKTKRHKIEIRDDDTFSVIDEVIEKAKEGKNILIIMNTVSTAQDVFEDLRRKNYKKVKLLHSRFIWEHRKNKEKEIKKDYNQEKGVIWVTTQLVEASLDIDFDILFTEVATADSLIQRMGRIWRHKKEDYRGEPNIYILTEVDEKKVSLIYEKLLRDKSIELIRKHLDNEGYLLSEAKRKIVETLYSKETLKSLGSKYLEKWEEVESILNSNWDFLFKREKAQRIFRDTFTFEAIPYIYKDEVKSLLKDLESIKQIPNKRERRSRKVDILRDINKFKVPVPIYWIFDDKGKLILSDKVCQLLDKDLNIYYLGECFEYSEELGLKPNKKLLKKIQI